MTTTNTTNTFKFAGLDLRCVTIEGQPWFAAADVCAILGLSRPDNMLRFVDSHERRVPPPTSRGTSTTRPCWRLPGTDRLGCSGCGWTVSLYKLDRNLLLILLLNQSRCLPYTR
ncbi:BRO-N domain-containing protein [Methylobacterium sp. 4-46]|uniref:BRO-N domain-containing protein n=1 Tax=unclassified Methylobacterium TaxID=2615210 RepID=UPI00143ADB7C